MNVLEYTQNLNDKMSITLKKVGVSSDSLKQDMRELKKEVDSLNNVKLDKFISSLSKIEDVLGIGTFIGKSITAGMEQGMKNASFEVLFGGAEPAKKMIDDITDYASKAYGTSALTDAVQLQAAFNIEPDEIMKNIKAIGDVAMGDVNKFNSLTLAFSQMSSTGKLMEQNLSQMIDAGFDPLVQMSKTSGKSIAQLNDDMSKGIISVQMVKQAFYDASAAGGQYNGMIERMANTAGGLWFGAQSKIEQRMLQLYNWLEPILIPALQQFNKFLADPIATIGQLTDKFTTSFPIITGVILAATAAVVGYKLAVFSLAALQVVISAMKSALVAYEIVVFAVRNATSLWAAAQWLINVAMTANPVGLVIAAIVALIAVIAFVILKTEGWGETWDNVIKFCSLVFDKFKTNLELKWLQIKDTFMSGLEVIERGWYKLQSLWNEDAANAGLAKLESQQNERAKEIANVKGKIDDLNKQIDDLDIWQVKMNDTSFSDIANRIKNKLGISAPGIPGTDGGAGGLGGLNGGGSGGAGSTVGGDTANSIATGGSKTTHITINLGELVGTINISKNGFRESAENMRDMIIDELTRALTMAQGQI